AAGHTATTAFQRPHRHSGVLVEPLLLKKRNHAQLVASMKALESLGTHLFSPDLLDVSNSLGNPIMIAHAPPSSRSRLARESSSSSNHSSGQSEHDMPLDVHASQSPRPRR